MRIVGVTTTGISVLECQHCGLVCESFRSLGGKEHLIDLCNCGKCGKNNRGETSTFDVLAFRKSHLKGDPK